ncbi:MAG: polysaccharide biosynthesis tyrosine autokinase [Bacteroidales bacterium]|nr:polysaccharide biosynthesis tyrosine autokinase [Candidatus Physcousia equi]
MVEQNNNEVTTQEEEKGFSISIKDIWNIVLLRWPWIVLSIVIALGGAWLYLRHQTPTYSASAKILIKDESGQGQRSKNKFDLSGMGIISNTDGFENELEIISSTTISNDVVKALNLNVRYFVPSRFIDKELYKCSPVVASMSEEEMESLNTTIRIELSPAGNGIHATTKIATNNPEPLVKETTISALPAAIETPVGTVQLESNGNYGKLDKQLSIIISPLKGMGRTYAARLTASPSSKTTTVAVLRLVDTQPQRAIDYLTQLMTSYNEDANRDKNEVASKTKEFINERIEAIGGELNATEGSLEQYKKENNLINLSNDATNALASSTTYQKEQVDIQTQITLVKSLIDYVNSPANEYQVIPANLGIKDALLNTQIAKYNETLLQYNRLAKSGAENNPAIAKLQEEVSILHAQIAQSLRNINNDLLVQKRSIDSQYALFQGRVSKTPTQERMLNDIGRQQEIKAGLYLTLLQKREENLISLASTATKAKWLDEPQVGGQVSPNSRMIWLIALLLGICAPIGIFFLLEKLRFRIEGRADVEKLTKLPLIADIPFAHIPNGVERAVVVAENTNDTMEESFRGLRTNMRFVMSGDQKVILCTSTVPGEGKTFVCTNLAMSFALLGKKVIIVGLDIRKPQLVRLFHLPSDKRGITNYLADNKADYKMIESQIYHGVLNANLDVMPAGIIPPNPGELISRSRLDDAINYLRGQYDVILLDTPPVGLVSDTLELGRLADVSIFVCRADYTPKNNFKLINALSSEGKLPQVNMVLNGVDLKKKKYGYYYGYGKYGRYGYHKYGKYGHYGHYGTYGNYGKEDQKSGKGHVEN